MYLLSNIFNFIIIDEFWMDLFQIVAWISVGVTALFTAFRLIHEISSNRKTRQEDLRWRKIEFLTAQHWKISSNPGVQKIIQMLSDEDNSELKSVFEEEGKEGKEDADLIASFDILFVLLNNLAYCVTEAETLQLSEVSEHFGWYYTVISRNKSVKNYCNKNGFKRVVLFAKCVENYFSENPLKE